MCERARVAPRCVLSALAAAIQKVFVAGAVGGHRRTAACEGSCALTTACLFCRLSVLTHGGSLHPDRPGQPCHLRHCHVRALRALPPRRVLPGGLLRGQRRRGAGPSACAAVRRRLLLRSRIQHGAMPSRHVLRGRLYRAVQLQLHGAALQGRPCTHPDVLADGGGAHLPLWRSPGRQLLPRWLVHATDAVRRRNLGSGGGQC